MINVICVLRSGGDYGVEDVTHLRNGVKLHMPMSIDYKFHCLTDEAFTATEVNTIPLRHYWPGWWSKIELFRNDLGLEKGRVIYFDLDTIITGPLLKLVECNCRFGMLSDFNHKTPASGVMTWDEDCSHIYKILLHHQNQSSIFYKNPNQGKLNWDQHYIDKVLQLSNMPITYLQDIIGIESYKLHVKRNENMTPKKDTSIVCFHGKPRPKEVCEFHSWISKNQSML